MKRCDISNKHSYFHREKIQCSPNEILQSKNSLLLSLILILNALQNIKTIERLLRFVSTSPENYSKLMVQCRQAYDNHARSFPVRSLAISLNLQRFCVFSSRTVGVVQSFSTWGSRPRLSGGS